MCDGDAGGGFDPIPPDPSVLPSDTVATDLTTWLRSFPLVVGMLLIAGAAFSGAFLVGYILHEMTATQTTEELIECVQRSGGEQVIFERCLDTGEPWRFSAVFASIFAAISLPISFFWLRPWRFEKPGRADVVSNEELAPNQRY